MEASFAFRHVYNIQYLFGAKSCNITPLETFTVAPSQAGAGAS